MAEPRRPQRPSPAAGRPPAVTRPRPSTASGDVRTAAAPASAPRSAGVATTTRPPSTSGTVATPWAKVAAAAPSNVSTRMQERLRERRAARTRLLTTRWATRLLIVAAGAGALWLLLLSPVFALDLDKVEASGFDDVVDPAEVDAVIAGAEGTSLALVNVSHLENQVRELTGVTDVQIDRVWPAGLRVTVIASEPVAAIPQADGTFALVDEHGVAVDSRDAAPTQLPVVSIPLATGDSRILDGVLGVIDEMPVELRDRVQNIEASTEDSIHFVLRDGPRVEWGSGEDSALKAEVLGVLLASPEASKADVIDVSAPTLPITRNE